jgi:hypothetical protein
MNQSLLHFKLTIRINDLHLCDFIEIQYLNEQLKSTKEYCVHMSVNRKISPVETIPGMGWEDKGEHGGDTFNYDML